jgi:chromosome segregation ATPase
MKELKQTIDRASKAMQKRDDKVNKETLTRIVALQKDVSTIKGNDPRELRAKASALAKELRSTKAALVDSKTEVRTLRKQLEEQKTVLDTAQQEVQSVQQRLTEQRTAQEATQKQNATTTEEREAEWRRRIGVLLEERDTMVEERKTLISERKTWKKERETMKKERETMSKVLMQQWGKEECGQQGEKEGKQAYRYKYVKKDQKP